MNAVVAELEGPRRRRGGGVSSQLAAAAAVPASNIAAPSSIVDVTEITAATINTFSRTREGDLGKFAYLNGGRLALERFFNTPGYDGKREEEFIPELAQRMAIDLPPGPFVLVELGPAKAYKRKTYEFIRAISEAAGVSPDQRIKEYVALDIVPDYTTEPQRDIQQEFNIKSSGLVADYRTIKDPVRPGENVVLIAWNPPVWNVYKSKDIDTDSICSFNIKRLGNIVGQDGHAILTHYPVIDAQKTVSVYHDENCEAAVLAIASSIQKAVFPRVVNLETGDPELLRNCVEYGVVWDPADSLIEMNLVMNGHYNVGIDRMSFEVGEGDVYTAVTSKKPSQERFGDIVAGLRDCRRKSTVASRSGDVVGQMLVYR